MGRPTESNLEGREFVRSTGRRSHIKEVNSLVLSVFVPYLRGVLVRMRDEDGQGLAEYALILAFIFLTPKGWFENSELRSVRAHQNMSVASQMLISPEFIRDGMSRSEIEQRVREVSGRADLTVSDVREKRDAAGKILVYEVDIR